MSIKTVVTLNKGGTKECQVPVSNIVIPDLWAIYMTLKKSNPESAEMVLECWHLAHDLRNHIERAKL